MNGMQRKAERRRREQRFTEDGLPLDANDWTDDDWRDLWMATEFVRRRVAERHRKDDADEL